MRPIIRFLVGSAATALVASCSDVATAPNRDGSKTVQSAPKSPFAQLSLAPPTTSSTIVLTSAGGTFVVGQYVISFPPNSVCSPSSSYGPTEWDKPCTTLQLGQFVVESVTTSASVGVNGIDFSPALRFAPNATVTIATTGFANIIKANANFFRATPAAANALAMYYSAGVGVAPTKDFAVDPSLLTHVNLTTGIISRRIKHFSGYVVLSGQSCTPSPDLPECVYVEDR